MKKARGKARRVKRRPEPVAGAREVGSGGGGVKPGVDAAEENLEVRRDDVAQALACRSLKISLTGPA
jgi:hypothetical protein